MKKLIPILLVLALALSLTGAAFALEPEVVRSGQRFTLDGESVSIDAYNIGGYNYVQLRGLAAVLNGTEKQFSVDWDEARNTVLLHTGEAYTPDESVYAGPAILTDAEGHVTNAVKSSQSLVVDGQTVRGLSAYNIGGHNYFKLADLQPYLGFGLGYDYAARTVQLTGDGTALPVSDPLAPAESYEQVRAYLARTVGSPARNADLNEYTIAESEAGDAVEAPAPAPAANTASASAGGRSADAADFSGTNVQVQGIDEGDIVKTDGKYIYVLNGDYHLTIIAADGEGSKVVSQTVIGKSEYNDGKDDYSSAHKSPLEMFVSDGVLVILSNYYSYHHYKSGDTWRYENEEYSCVDFYDVSAPARPRLLNSLGQDGNVLSTRMVDGHVYVVTRYWVWDYDEDDPGSYVPVVYANGVARTMPADCIYICGSGTEYVVVGDYDAASGTLKEVKSLLGSGDEVYMSGANLYVLGSAHETNELRTYRESVYTVTEYENTSNTEIHRFDLSGGGLALAASGKIPGYIDSQFSADERDGYLRIVTTRGDSRYSIYEDDSYDFRNYKWEDSESSSGLYILDADLNVTGSVTGLAKEERVYSVRFDGDIAYFCTFRNVDPLFTVDVSDPANPQVMNALKISGFSDYLHAWTDGKLFGFGQEADEETGRTDGLKLVMFDTSDKTDVKVENTYALTDVRYSEALYNHKAFFIVPEKNLIGFLGENDYYIFSYDESAGFKQLCHFAFDTPEWNVRGLYIGGFAYIVGNEELMIVDMGTWAAPTPVNIAAPGSDGGYMHIMPVEG